MEKININYIKEKLKNSYDVKYREIKCEQGIIFGVFIDDMCDSKFISEYIFNPLIQKNIETIINNGDSCYIAVDENKIVGFIIAVREKFIRTQHVATIVIGILEEYCGKGIGSLLFQNVINWANENKVKRLELTVIAENQRAMNLYKKVGFKLEGTREKSIFKDGKYYDELYMSKIIDLN